MCCSLQTIAIFLIVYFILAFHFVQGTNDTVVHGRIFGKSNGSELHHPSQHKQPHAIQLNEGNVTNNPLFKQLFAHDQQHSIDGLVRRGVQNIHPEKLFPTTSTTTSEAAGAPTSSISMEQVVAEVQHMKSMKGKRKKSQKNHNKHGQETEQDEGKDSRKMTRSLRGDRSDNNHRRGEEINAFNEESPIELGGERASSSDSPTTNNGRIGTNKGNGKVNKVKKYRTSRRKKGSGTGPSGTSGRGDGSGNNEMTRAKQMTRTVDRIIQESDRYHMWWTGPLPETSSSSDNPHFFSPERWAASHRPEQHAVFTVAFQQGKSDQVICSHPNQFILYLGSLRKYFSGDIVMAMDIDLLNDVTKRILLHYQVIVYLLPKDLCSKESRFIYCGSEEERVPMTAFRYYFYEKWSLQYNETSLILLSDFRDVIFQGNPFQYQLNEWYPSYSLAVFQEFYPNMLIQNCVFNKQLVQECYGNEILRTIGSRVIISSGAMIGSRDGILVWSNAMTKQLQDAPGRMVETRCSSGGIEHSFINYLIYYSKLRGILRIRLFHHGEGSVNSVGGLQPNTVQGNLTGSLQSFWKLLSKDGVVLNWNGEASPVVHQLDHFSDELMAIAEQPSSRQTLFPDLKVTAEELKKENRSHDLLWQVIQSTRCLFDCRSSVSFS
eukprot:gene14508-16064_t